MAEANVTSHELPNVVTLLAKKLEGTAFAHYLHIWENVIFSLIIVCVVSLVAYLSSRKRALIPNRLQAFVELIVGGLDDFICGIIGPKGRKFTPFIGTLFLYILLMNLFGLIPFMKSSTSSLSTTAALALCVFLYVQYTSIKEMGIIGYFDHLMGSPRGVIALSVFVPLLLLIIHIITELVRPLSLALRLGSNIMAEDKLLAISANFGIIGVPLLFFSMLLTILFSLIQAVVFTLLSTVYFALVLSHEE